LGPRIAALAGADFSAPIERVIASDDPPLEHRTPHPDGPMRRSGRRPPSPTSGGRIRARR
jgi:hypothetical protein